MRETILLLLLIFTTSIFAQKCKFKINEVDEFTKNKILETRPAIFTSSGVGLGFSSSYSLKKINDEKYLKFKITSSSIFTLREGNKVMFKTNKEETINLKFPETIIANGSYNTSFRTTFWTGEILIPISDEINKRFQNEKIIKLRVYTGDGYVDGEINSKRATKFVEHLKCIQ